MKCPRPSCQFESNPSNSRFCIRCGADLKASAPDEGVRGKFLTPTKLYAQAENLPIATSASLKKIEGLNPREYEHPLDKQALDAVQAVRGLDAVTRFINDYGLERFLRLQFVGSNLRVTASSFPDIYSVLEDACEVLNLKEIPELYIQGNDYFRTLSFPTNSIQGITVGVKNPVIVISNECVENLSESELLFILGCEIGRIKSQHLLYQDMSYLLPLISKIALAGIVADGLIIALTQWERMSDYTADRAGLLACQDIDVAMKTMAKIAGLPRKYFDSFLLDDFITQAREFEGFGDSIVNSDVLSKNGIFNKIDNIFNKFIKGFSSAIRDQAFTIARAQELLKWIDSGGYRDVLERKTRIRYCVNPNCKQELQSLAGFCPACGTQAPEHVH